MSNNCRRFEDKVAIVTAATKGIGLAIAERLLAEGASVVIGSRSQKHVDEALDYLNKKGLTKVVGIAGHIANVDDQKKLVEVNVKAGFQMTKLVAPHIAKQGGGAIVFNGSNSAYKSPPGVAGYGITKTTLLGLTRALAMGMANDNIRVNGIAPGVIKTKMSEMLWAGGEKAEKELADEMEIALGRLGLPEDCVGTVAFLASDDSSYITGETIVIAGGVQSRI